MNLSLIRQPIYNENFVPIGYEISYQPQGDAPVAADYSDQDSLICRVLTHAFFGFGKDQLTGGKPVYAALTNMLLLEGMPGQYRRSGAACVPPRTHHGASCL